MGSLNGLLVVALEQAVAAPLCSSRLAYMGARVIKIERPGGDFARAYDDVVNGDSAYFVWLNRGKESIVLDIKSNEDRDLLHRIISRADVFIQNLAPGAAERASFGSETLRARHPHLITCDISGYGEEGPYRDMKAYDLLVQAETGLCMVTGTESEPGRVGVSVCDIAGGLNALTGILESLYKRERTGAGSGVQVSLFDGMADWMNVPFLYQRHGADVNLRAGLKHPSIAPYGAFSTVDGKSVLISIQNEREWQSLCVGVLEEPTLVDDPRFSSPSMRLKNRDAVDGTVAACFSKITRDAAISKLRGAGVAYGALNDVADLADHPQLRIVEYEAPSGPVRVIAPPVRHSGGQPKLKPVPKVGAQTEAIRGEFAS